MEQLAINKEKKIINEEPKNLETLSEKPKDSTLNTDSSLETIKERKEYPNKIPVPPNSNQKNQVRNIFNNIK